MNTQAKFYDIEINLDFKFRPNYVRHAVNEYTAST